MSLFNGLLLFDIAETSINNWEEQLGYRGYMYAWKKRNKTITIEVDEDANPEGAFDKVVWEAWWANDATGDCESIAFGTFDYVEKAAKEYMRKN